MNKEVSKSNLNSIAAVRTISGHTYISLRYKKNLIGCYEHNSWYSIRTIFESFFHTYLDGIHLKKAPASLAI